MPSVPAAQYLRMSTELQQYSLENQSAAIAQYAEQHGFTVVKTYADPARSGLSLKARTGLRQLLNDVVSGTPEFKLILVYDVSRWGRFQDTDEAAHYEYLCKSAGIPVHYCAEQFANDNSMAGLIMKSLKRTMAGEFSRELSVKVLAGQRRLSAVGYRMGSFPGYGLRRMLLGNGSTPKQVLQDYERKSIVTDRIKLVPGPPEEVAVVREIFRMFVEDGMTAHAIVRELNRRGVDPHYGKRWLDGGIYQMLRNPKYCGCLVFGKTSQKLLTPTAKVPSHEWIVVPGAYEPIITAEVFEKAQEIIRNRTYYRDNDRLLEDLRRLLAEKGCLNKNVINACPYTAAVHTYYLRFGALHRAYELIGYKPIKNCQSMAKYKALNRRLRGELMEKIVALFPNEVTILKGRRICYRSRLRLRNRRIVSVLIARSVRLLNGELRWFLSPVRKECRNVTLLARLSESNGAIFDLHVLPSVDKRSVFFLREKDDWLRRGVRLRWLKSFLRAVDAVAKSGV
jgi:DNA invertase Pin-like site-specific DNA recombinase